MDIHHILKFDIIKKMKINYNRNKAISIVLPTKEHFFLTKDKNKMKVNSVEELIKNSIFELEKHTNIPKETLDIIKFKLNKEYNES